MGYTTVFRGHFSLSPALNPAQIAYLTHFAYIRHMIRDSTLCRAKPDPLRAAVNLDVGTDGEFFVAAEGDYGQGHDETIIEYNSQPKTQPSLWCQWVPTKDGTRIEWNRGEKFYCCEQWIEYMIANFLEPWGVKIEGKIEFAGEDPSDKGYLKIVDGHKCDRVFDASIDSKEVWASW
ncbi:hypothetical protein BCR44DRAFT_33347 [Catenaria anguillulae PL171]|uniref:Uncharacterized protein n=1 Tax=Catenaria anguillulae PL171 TaxID=765915 RepID=A0A1Y2HWT1_9FUNG|nr:hypothetical protein BCR44DRAFT_33347 [Catenaria anguillulae PL171]